MYHILGPCFLLVLVGSILYLIPKSERSRTNPELILHYMGSSKPAYIIEQIFDFLDDFEIPGWFISTPSPKESRYWGLVHSPLLGKRWTRITAVDQEGRDILDVDLGGGINNLNYFKQFYSTGILKAEGMCYVNWSGDQIDPNFHDELQWAKFYKPDGTLDCEVKEGTGIQRYWYEDGQIFRQLMLRDGERVELTTWDQEGMINHHTLY